MSEYDATDSQTRPTPPLPPPLPEPPRRSDAPTGRPAGTQKSPPLAAVLSFILPGLGHLYAESYRRGPMLFASFVLGILLTIRWWPFVFLCVFLWFFGMFDSFRDAQLANLGPGDRPAGAGSRDGGSLLFGAYLLLGGGVLLLDNFNVINLDWFFHDWWPAFVVAAGLYFVIAAFRDRKKVER
jgi:hypothetical protein